MLGTRIIDVSLRYADPKAAGGEPENRGSRAGSVPEVALRNWPKEEVKGRWQWQWRRGRGLRLGHRRRCGCRWGRRCGRGHVRHFGIVCSLRLEPLTNLAVSDHELSH